MQNPSARARRAWRRLTRELLTRRQTGRSPLVWGLTFALGVLLTIAPLPVTATSSPVATPAIAPIADSTPETLERRARSQYQQRQFAAAAAGFDAAAEGYRQTGDRLAEAGSHTYRALALLELGRAIAAQSALARSTTLLDALDGDPVRRRPVAAQTALAQGRVHLATGQTQAALASWQQAASLYAALDDPLGELGALNNQAIALQRLGLYRRSQTLLETVTERLSAIDDPQLRVSALRDLAVARQVVGNLEEARSLLQDALETARSQNLISPKSAILRALGDTDRALGNFDAALENYADAAQLAPSDLDTVTVQLERASAALADDRRSLAADILAAVEPKLVRLPPSRRAIYARVRDAHIRLELGTPDPRDRQQLAARLATGIDQAQALGDDLARAYALKELARLYRVQGDRASAIDLTQRAIAAVSGLQADDVLARASAQLGELYEAEGERSPAIAAYSNAVRALQARSRDLVAINPEIRQSFRDSVEPVYRSLVSLLLSGTPNQAELNQARQTIEALQVAELDNFFREACLEGSPKDIDRVDPHAAALYPIVLRDRLEVILSLPGEPLRSYRTPLSRDRLQRTLDRFRQSLSLSFARSEQLALYGELYDWLVRPAEADLQRADIETLVFVLDSGLRNLPMSVLYDGDRYLVEKYNLAIAPSLQLLEPRPLDNQRLQVVVAGLSQARQGFTALPGVESEVDRITRTIPTSDVRLNQEFTTEATRTALQRANSPVLHLATHGQFSSDADDTFILTWDGKLNVSELGQLLQRRDEQRAGALELLVLSACQTAFGDDRATLGLAGLAVRSGARATVATLWAVRDRSTAVFMAEFYRQLAIPGNSKAHALREAQLSLLRQPEYSRPFYWAPFISIGNWL